MIVENKTGAAGRLAVDACRTAQADGAAMLLTPASVFTMYPFIYKKLSYDPQADFAAVSLAADFSHALAVGPMVPESVTNAREFMRWCKGNPGKASCGNPGAGSLPHFIRCCWRAKPVSSCGTSPIEARGRPRRTCSQGRLRRQWAPREISCRTSNRAGFASSH